MRFIAAAFGALAILALASVSAAAVVVGTPGDDVLRGTDQPDRISAFAASVDLVRDDEGDHPALAREQVGWQRLALAQAVDGLACPATRVEYAVAVVEDDHRLPALLDEHSSTSGIGVRHVTAF